MTPDQIHAIARTELTPKQLEVYELRYRSNMSLRQIALATGIAVETVRSRLAAGERRIANAIRRDAA